MTAPFSPDPFPPDLDQTAYEVQLGSSTGDNDRLRAALGRLERFLDRLAPDSDDYQLHELLSLYRECVDRPEGAGGPQLRQIEAGVRQFSEQARPPVAPREAATPNADVSDANRMRAKAQLIEAETKRKQVELFAGLLRKRGVEWRAELVDGKLRYVVQKKPGALEQFAVEPVRGREVESASERRVYKNCTVIEGSEMRDNYQAGQAGAMGPNARAENVNFVQVLRDGIGASSLADLAADLERLRLAMLAEAKSGPQDAAVQAVAAAEDAAKKGDAKGVLASLKTGGQWALDVATKIGTAVAGKAIEKSMGL